MRWSSESGKKTCSQVDASTEAGFMHSYVVGHIGLDPSQPSILRNGDRGRRESSRQVPVRLFGLSVLSRRFFTIVTHTKTPKSVGGARRCNALVELRCEARDV